MWKGRVEWHLFFPCGWTVQLEKAGAGGLAGHLPLLSSCIPSTEQKNTERVWCRLQFNQRHYRLQSRLSLIFTAPLMALTFVPQNWHLNLIEEMHEITKYYGKENNPPNWFFSSLALYSTLMHSVECRYIVRPQRKQTVKEIWIPGDINKGSPVREAPTDWMLNDLKVW